MRDIIIANMNTSAPELAPLFRSDSQAEILGRLLLNSDRTYSIADLARTTRTSYATTHREVQRLIRLGLVTEERIGRNSQLAAATRHPMYAPLAELLRLSYGPAAVMPEIFAPISGIEAAYIYGSWAARRAGEPGSPPGDIDVLVVGDPSRSAIDAAADEAERLLGREVNVRIVSRGAWDNSIDPFIQTVRERPLSEVDISVKVDDSLGTRT